MLGDVTEKQEINFLQNYTSVAYIIKKLSQIYTYVFYGS